MVHPMTSLNVDEILQRNLAGNNHHNLVPVKEDHGDKENNGTPTKVNRAANHVALGERRKPAETMSGPARVTKTQAVEKAKTVPIDERPGWNSRVATDTAKSRTKLKAVTTKEPPAPAPAVAKQPSRKVPEFSKIHERNNVKLQAKLEENRRVTKAEPFKLTTAAAKPTKAEEPVEVAAAPVEDLRRKSMAAGRAPVSNTAARMERRGTLAATLSAREREEIGPRVAFNSTLPAKPSSAPAAHQMQQGFGFTDDDFADADAFESIISGEGLTRARDGTVTTKGAMMQTQPAPMRRQTSAPARKKEFDPEEALKRTSMYNGALRVPKSGRAILMEAGVDVNSADYDSTVYAVPVTPAKGALTFKPAAPSTTTSTAVAAAPVSPAARTVSFAPTTPAAAKNGGAGLAPMPAGMTPRRHTMAVTPRAAATARTLNRALGELMSPSAQAQTPGKGLALGSSMDLSQRVRMSLAADVQLTGLALPTAQSAAQLAARQRLEELERKEREAAQILAQVEREKQATLLALQGKPAPVAAAVPVAPAPVVALKVAAPVETKRAEPVVAAAAAVSAPKVSFRIQDDRLAALQAKSQALQMELDEIDHPISSPPMPAPVSVPTILAAAPVAVKTAVTPAKASLAAAVAVADPVTKAYLQQMEEEERALEAEIAAQEVAARFDVDEGELASMPSKPQSALMGFPVRAGAQNPTEHFEDRDDMLNFVTKCNVAGAVSCASSRGVVKLERASSSASTSSSSLTTARLLMSSGAFASN